jgi:hypothetical protein
LGPVEDGLVLRFGGIFVIRSRLSPRDPPSVTPESKSNGRRIVLEDEVGKSGAARDEELLALVARLRKDLGGTGGAAFP